MVRLSNFLLRVLRDFRRNQGLLLSGAVAFYTLLSIVPLSILALIVLTQFVEEQQLIHTLSTYLEMVIPGYAATLTEQVRAFLEHRKAVGVIGFLVMLFFSSFAFSMLENAMSVIFFQRVRIQRRNFLISAIIPYAYIFGLYDPEVEETNAGAKAVKDMVFRYWTEEELVAKIARLIKVKDSKIAKMRAENSTWPFANVNLVIPTDEITITREMADSMQGRFCTLEANNLNEVYLLLSYNPAIKGRPLIQIR